MRCLVLLLLLSIALTCHAGYVVDYSTGLGRTFDGIGGLSGGGATSKLLINYPKAERDEILDYLFKPNFGASLQILKVEIGGDAQSTDGTESSHMHESWDENYERGYEWWLITEAKKRNPDIKLCALAWAFPGWVGKGNNPYVYPNETARYVVKWILGARKFYNATIDYVGIWNERNYNVAYVKALKDMLLSSSLTSSVKVIVADDGDWSVSDAVLRDPSFASAVDIIGVHYPGTTSSDASVKTGKPLWASEDYSTFNNDVGAGCWARILNQNYVNGFMTSTISWNLIASYYDHLPYARDGLMTAMEPWSGHYVVESPIWVSAHTTQFTQIGWNYLKHGHGVGKLDHGGSYVTLISPDKKHITIIIETMTHDHSVCIRPGLPPYKVVAQQATFQLAGELAGIEKLYVWKTQLNFGGKKSTLFEVDTAIKPFSGIFTVLLYPDQLYTLTTLSVGTKGAYQEPPPSKPFPLPYTDDFEGYAEYSEAYNFAPQSGVWEVRQTNDPTHGKVNRQVILHDPIYWCNTGPSTLNLGGNYAWANVRVSVDVFIPSANGSLGAFVAGRVDGGGCDAHNAHGVFFFIFANNSSYVVTADISRHTILAAGTCSVVLDKWFSLQLILKDKQAYGFLGTLKLFSATLPTSPKNGFAAYGTPEYGYADFDNFAVDSADGAVISSDDIITDTDKL